MADAETLREPESTVTILLVGDPECGKSTFLS